MASYFEPRADLRPFVADHVDSSHVHTEQPAYQPAQIPGNNRHNRLYITVLWSKFTGISTGTNHMTFPRDIQAFTPLLPLIQGEIPGYLRDLALELNKASARLAGRAPRGMQKGLIELLRVVNSYYSNLIEGHHTRLADAERALRADFDTDEKTRALQLEAAAHIRAEEAIDQRLEQEPDLDPTSMEFITWLHQIFYEQLPEELRVVTSEHGRERQVIPGELRDEEVVVGRHYPPAAAALPRFMSHFQQAYQLGKHHGDSKFIAAAASHHRLAWIHPFFDGNGRTTRLFSHAYLSQFTEGYRLWSISRGLARSRDQYMGMLAAADTQRRNDLDGRGMLSAEGLAGFCRYFLESALDQAQFMDELLQLEQLRERVLDYAERRAAGRLPGIPPIRKEACPLLAELAVRGEVPRGEVQAITGYAERAARKLTSELLDTRLISSDHHRAPLRLSFTSETVEFYLPRLYTGDVRAG